MSEQAMIALGSNVGARAAYLAGARTAIASLPATRLLAASRVEETAPFGSGAQGPYLNQMVLVSTRLSPRALLHALQRIERALGRRRSLRWGARTLDLDVVRYGEVRCYSSELRLPHPGLAARDFWRRELAELQAIAGHAA
jgi:2-amino-4-hydroxy-6-hydroxymethyldihydropteridine diphosphokinase